MEKQTSKKCPSCGKEISEASVFCPFCRAKMEVSPSVSSYGDATLERSSVEHVVEEKPALLECEKREAAERQAMPRKGSTIPFVIGIVAGAVMVLFGAMTFFSASVGCEATSFGGDAYTYIYRGIVASAQTLYCICQAIGVSMICGGVAICCAFAAKIRE